MEDRAASKSTNLDCDVESFTDEIYDEPVLAEQIIANSPFSAIKYTEARRMIKVHQVGGTTAGRLYEWAGADLNRRHTDFQSVVGFCKCL